MARKSKQTYDGLVYDLFLWIFTIVVDLFFREIHPRSSWRIPRTGPIIFVAAPHANQFIDPLLLMRTVRHDAGRRISFLIAAKSMKRKFIGFGAKLVGSVPVGRALDLTKPAPGKIFLSDPEGDPTLIKGTETDFTTKQFMPGGLVVLPSVDNTAANAEIQEVLGPNELRLKKPFKGDVAYKQLTGRKLKESNGHAENGDAESPSGGKFDGINFKVAPHVDQAAVYESVFDKIKEGGCIGIFPEGGSHDRTELLPLKAGVAIMALGALADDPDCDVKIVPVGMNYFHAHKFRSRAVIEFGTPVEVSNELLQEYKNGNKREATGKLLDEVYNGLSAVTTLAPDYDTLMLVQAVRRLYNPKGKKLPLSQVVELNRRLMKGYTTYKDNPKVVSLRKAVLDYNRQLFRINIRDHQLSYARFPWYKVIATLIYRLWKLAVLSVAVLPGTILFSPVFIAGKVISMRKSKEALAASTVKIKARDVIATWKVLVSLALAPTLDVWYTSLLAYWHYRNHCNGHLPAWLPVWALVLIGLIFFPSLCFLALRFGEIGMDIIKSLRPLLLSLNPTSGNTLVRLRARREGLQEQVNALINELGPELFPDFDHQRLVADPAHPYHGADRASPTSPTTAVGLDDDDPATSSSPSTSFSLERMRAAAIDSLPRNESFSNLGSIGLFATRPNTPNRSRSRGGSEDFGKGGLTGFTSVNETKTKGGKSGKKTKEELDEVSRGLKVGMRERGRRRGTLERESEGFVDDSEDEGVEVRKGR